MSTNRQSRRIIRCRTRVLLLCLLASSASVAGAEKGAFARFRLVEPADQPFYVQLTAYMHVTPWTLPPTVFPAEAHRHANRRVAAGEPTEWFDVKAYLGDKLHGRMNRSGGVAEFPNISVTFVASPDKPVRKVIIELATAAVERAIVKRFEESLGPLSGLTLMSWLAMTSMVLLPPSTISRC